jgi:hypothetical protein
MLRADDLRAAAVPVANQTGCRRLTDLNGRRTEETYALNG